MVYGFVRDVVSAVLMLTGANASFSFSSAYFEKGQEPDNVVKVILIGEDKVGKSVLYQRLQQRNVPKVGDWNYHFYQPGMPIFSRRIQRQRAPEALEYIHIWDAPPSNKPVWYSPMNRQYDKPVGLSNSAVEFYSNVNVVVLVYDVTNHHSFAHLQKHLLYVLTYNQDALDNIELFIVGNATHLSDRNLRQVSDRDRNKLIRELTESGWKNVTGFEFPFDESNVNNFYDYLQNRAICSLNRADEMHIPVESVQSCTSCHNRIDAISQAPVTIYESSHCVMM